jgi:hypothetical protein
LTVHVGDIGASTKDLLVRVHVVRQSRCNEEVKWGLADFRPLGKDPGKKKKTDTFFFGEKTLAGRIRSGVAVATARSFRKKKLPHPKKNAEDWVVTA